MYSNIPITETKKILDDVTRNNLVDTDTRQERLSWYDTITKQNYFRHKENITIQKEGLAMGAPSSSILSEIFLQHAEHSHLPYLTQKHKIINYFRYVDDILLIYDSTQTNIQTILENFKSIYPNLTFTGETEHENVLSFLDITIHKTPRNIKISIYRKPTFTDTIIPYTSNQPPQHKYSAVRFLYNRLNSYHLEKDEYQKELDTIHHILHNSSFPIPSRTQHTPKRPPPLPPTTESERILSTVTYSGKESKYITDLFRHSNIQVAFRTNSTSRNLLSHNTHQCDAFTQSGVYKLTCPGCGKAYIGQTGRYFTSRYHEHKLPSLTTRPPQISSDT